MISRKVWIALTRGFCPSSTPSPPSNVTAGSGLVIQLTAYLSHHVDLLPGSRLSEASPMLLGCDLLAKYRPWPIRLTWQEKHKPGDKLCTQTRSQIDLFKHTCALVFIHAQDPCPVCAGTPKYDNTHLSVHSVSTN